MSLLVELCIASFKSFNSWMFFSFCWIVMEIWTIVEICGEETKGRTTLIAQIAFAEPCLIFILGRVMKNAAFLFGVLAEP